MAVFSLPPEMLGFYKKHIVYIEENAVNPDQRRYAIKDEAPKHYIDWDMYSDSLQKKLPQLYFSDAEKLLSRDTIMAHGIVPWQIQMMTYQLTQAFEGKNSSKILKISADLGHYIADSNVPLHTTRNYNGQLTDQVGIHGFWESRLPELFYEDYDLWVDKAVYEKNVKKRSWNAVLNAHSALDSVLKFEKRLTETFGKDKKYTVEERNGITTKQYSRGFSKTYHKELENQVNRQMRASIKMVADLWYTAWVNAGQPDLLKYDEPKIDASEDKLEKKAWLQKILDVRKESDDK
ncbi:MAG: zinc dependent phospholipase C family protein [Leadbetterella sp.]